LRPAREINDSGSIAGKISDGGINLAQCDLHIFSVTAADSAGQVRDARSPQTSERSENVPPTMRICFTFAILPDIGKAA
jgi:hypothetical protein